MICIAISVGLVALGLLLDRGAGYALLWSFGIEPEAFLAVAYAWALALVVYVLLRAVSRSRGN